MMRIAVFLTAILTVCVFTAQAQITITESGRESHFVPQSRTFLPHNWVRGYTDFSVAPSHNEPDLGRCMFPQRSEEHTSELQSQSNLVCRLLLEKKKITSFLCSIYASIAPMASHN